MTTTLESASSAADVQTLFALAQREHNAGRLVDAAAAYRQVIMLRPGYAEAYINLGNVLMTQGRVVDAAAHYEHALALNPGLVQAHNNLGNILRDQGDLEQATARFEHVLALEPNHAEAHNNLGNLLCDRGIFDEAATYFERAVTLKPSLYQAHNSLGSLLKQQGKFKEAAARYRQALAMHPDSAEGYFNLSDLKTFHAGDPDLAAMEAIAADVGRLPPGKMVYMHFALAKALEDVSEYGRAFEHLLQGNALKRREVNYNEAANQQTIAGLIYAFDSALPARFRGVGDPSTVPIFVLGMPRSGSTLVEQILASHPQVHGAGELMNLSRVVTEASDAARQSGGLLDGPRTFEADDYLRIGQAYLASLPPSPEGKTRITDKAPGNFFQVGLIHLVLPNARIIHTMRDPVDTCLSCFSRLFTRGQTYSYNLSELGRYYRGYHELMAHWRSILPAGAMLEVSYEEVVNNLEEQARRLIDFCGLPWDDRCLSFHKTRRPISTASTVQVRQPVYRTSVQRWRRYEAYLQPLLTELESCREVRPGEKASSIRQQQKENTTTALSPSPGGLSEADALFALAERQSRAGHLIEAAATYRKLIAIRPTDAEGHNNLGNMLNALGKIDEAADHYQRAVTLKPNLAEAHNNLGNVLRDRGELGRALAHYEQALKLRPNFAEAHYYRSDLKTFRAGDPDLAALEALAADSAGLSPSKRLYIHFALGKALEDVGDYRRAFEHLLEGNALMRREVNHNDVANQQTIRGLASTFDSGTLARFQGVGDPTTVPIFVLGMPRSGSTLVEQILASHPQVHGGGELMNLNSTIVANSKVSGRSGLSRENPVFEIESFRRLGQAYVASLPPLPDGKTRITDKAPSNFFQIGLIRLILPNARIVHTMRDPADTCLSCFSRLFTRGQTYSYNLSELGRYYRGYHELMAHWRSILSAGAMLDVSYEEVVDNLEEQARRLIDFCGLPWDDRCLSFHKTRRPISTACTVQVRQPVYRTSVQRWRRYEAYLQPLLTELEGCGRY